jgi:hypothetical protein
LKLSTPKFGCNGTEDGITNELLAAGIPQKDIVLGFHEPEVRQYTGFAVAQRLGVGMLYMHVSL